MQVTLDLKLLPEMQMKAPVTRVVGVCYIPLLPPECLITIIPSWDLMTFVSKYSPACFKEGCVKIAQGGLTGRKSEAETGMRGRRRRGRSPRASILSVSRQLWGCVDTVGILSEFRIRR